MNDDFIEVTTPHTTQGTKVYINVRHILYITEGGKHGSTIMLSDGRVITTDTAATALVQRVRDLRDRRP